MNKKILMIGSALFGIITTLSIFIVVFQHMEQASNNTDTKPDIAAKNDAVMKLIDRGDVQTYENGYYMIKDLEHIMYFDYATQKEVYLCNKPNCKHEDESCSSYLNIAEVNEIFYYDQRLYLVNAQEASNVVSINDAGTTSMASDNGNPSTVYRMDLDGTNRKKLFTVPSGTQISMPYVIKGNQMFTFLEYYEHIQDKQNSFTTNITSRKLIAINLDNGSYEEIDDAMNDSFIGIYDNKIILQEIIYAQDPNLFDDDISGYIDNMYHSDIQIKLFDIESKKSEALFKESFIDAEQIKVGENGIYMLGQHSKTLKYYDINKRQKSDFTQLSQSDMTLAPIIDNKLLVYHYKDEEAHIDRAEIIDLKSKEQSEFHLKDTNDYLVEILASNDKYYFVQMGYTLGEEYTTWAGTTQQDIVATDYGLILKEDYWNSKANYLKMENAK